MTNDLDAKIQTLKQEPLTEEQRAGIHKMEKATHLQKQFSTVLALLERWVKDFESIVEPGMLDADNPGGKLYDDTKTLLKEAKEMKRVDKN